MSLLFPVYRCLFSPHFHCCLVGDGINRTCLLTVSASFCAPGQQPIMMSRSGTVITAREGRGALCAGGSLTLDGPGVGASLHLGFKTQSGARPGGLGPAGHSSEGRGPPGSQGQQVITRLSPCCVGQSSLHGHRKDLMALNFHKRYLKSLIANQEEKEMFST